MTNVKLHIFAMTGFERGNSQWNTEHNKHVNQRKTLLSSPNLVNYKVLYLAFVIENHTSTCQPLSGLISILRQYTSVYLVS